MCTVTYLPTRSGAIITSNRDEHHTRSHAFAPAQEELNGDQLLYPKDPDAGGSWIAARSNGHCAVLLNGAFTRHVSTPPYRRSRGMVLREVIGSNDPVQTFGEMDLSLIEPFTIILFAPGRLCEGRWDGEKKHLKDLSTRQPHIWCSATLYDMQDQQKREKEWQAWIDERKKRNVASVADLHRKFLLHHKNGISTVSITSLSIHPRAIKLTYRDLMTGTTAVSVVKTPRTTLKKDVAEVKLYLRRTLIRMRHWEYWPFALVYFPVLPYWLWLSMKARSFFFFSAANPSIENAGFVLERKNLIYALIPEDHYPKTILCSKQEEIGNWTSRMTAKNMAYPLIAKPDIGQKGMAVKLLASASELRQYHASTAVDFLLQEYIPYEKEVGIFYYRIPGESRGRLSGMVGKEFVTVTGDGASTVEELLLREDRFVLQLPVLRKTYGASLHNILPSGTMYTLVPYGNHSRGAKFIDLSAMIDERLTHTIDTLCKSIRGFYYGRLDIKFNDWEELRDGKNFSIIELNGAGSEPTHMYDPAHSLFFAWREIIKHWNILYAISRKNAKEKGISLMCTSHGLRMLKDNAAYLKLIS